MNARRPPSSIDASDGRATRFLHELVSIPSVSGDERAAAERFAREAADLALDASIDNAGNAIGVRGRPDAPRTIALVGHIDTVPGDIPVRIEGGVLHGRGSVDAKGPLAALLYGAARADLSEDIRIVVGGCVGEETTGSPGARHLRARLRPDACVIGEPSGWRGVTLGYKGRLIARARCERPRAHTAGPDSGAMDALLAWRERVLDWTRSENAVREHLFDRIQTRVTSARTEDDDPFTDRATLALGFRLPRHASPERVEAVCAALAGRDVTLSFEGAERAHCVTRADPVVGALSAAIHAHGERPRHLRKTGTADLNVVAPVWSCPIAAYGPGDSSLDHTPEERLDLAEFTRSIGVLTMALERLASILPQRATSGQGSGSCEPDSIFRLASG